MHLIVVEPQGAHLCLHLASGNNDASRSASAFGNSDASGKASASGNDDASGNSGAFGSDNRRIR